MARKKIDFLKLQKQFDIISQVSGYFEPFDTANFSGGYDSLDHSTDRAIIVNGVVLSHGVLLTALKEAEYSKADIDKIQDLYKAVCYVNSLMYDTVEGVKQRLFDVANYGQVKTKDPAIPENDYSLNITTKDNVVIAYNDPDVLKIEL